VAGEDRVKRNCIIIILHWILFGRVKSSKVSGACSTRERSKKYLKKILVLNAWIDHWEDFSADGRKVLNGMLNKSLSDCELNFGWLRTWSSG
jgi:hypothetical protein